ARIRKRPHGDPDAYEPAWRERGRRGGHDRCDASSRQRGSGRAGATWRARNSDAYDSNARVARHSARARGVRSRSFARPLFGVNESRSAEGKRMPDVSMIVNGLAVRRAVEGRTLLVDFLRESLGLTGTHVGCETTQCGACVVHVNGKAMKSCTMLALQCEGATVTTIEGLAPIDAPLHPMQAACREHHALQCG